MALSNVASPPLTDTACLTFLIDHAVSNNLSVAVWRLPHDEVTYAIISKEPQLLNPTQTLEDQLPGFIFAPFDTSADRIFLPGDYCFSFSNGRLNSAISAKEIASTAWLNDRLNKTHAGKKHPDVYLSTTDTSTPSTTRDFFLRLVREGITEIEKGNFEKVVLSRTKVVDLPSFDVTEGFQKLCSLYPNALISFVSISETGSWLGATPEVLVSVEDKKIFRTIALAGTQPFSAGTNLKTVAWTQKTLKSKRWWNDISSVALKRYGFVNTMNTDPGQWSLEICCI